MSWFSCCGVKKTDPKLLAERRDRERDAYVLACKERAEEIEQRIGAADKRIPDLQQRAQAYLDQGQVDMARTLLSQKKTAEAGRAQLYSQMAAVQKLLTSAEQVSHTSNIADLMETGQRVLGEMSAAKIGDRVQDLVSEQRETDMSLMEAGMALQQFARDGQVEDMVEEELNAMIIKKRASAGGERATPVTAQAREEGAAPQRAQMQSAAQ